MHGNDMDAIAPGVIKYWSDSLTLSTCTGTSTRILPFVLVIAPAVIYIPKTTY